MNRILLVTIACMFYCSTSLAEEESAAAIACGGFDSTGLIEGKPLIRVEPVVGPELREDMLDSCVIVVYGLKEKRGTDGAALLAYRPKAVAHSNDVTRKEKKAAERAMSKWLFLAKTHEASKEPVYYSVIVY